MDIDKLKYSSTERVFEGVIVELDDASATIDIKGRLGRFRFPRRMIFCQEDLLIGQEVAFLMSYPEVLDPQPNEDYLDAIRNRNERQKRIQAKFNTQERR